MKQTSKRWEKDWEDFLRTFWGSYSATGIARMMTALFGYEFTRNSIIGKVNRMGLSK